MHLSKWPMFHKLSKTCHDYMRNSSVRMIIEIIYKAYIRQLSTSKQCVHTNQTFQSSLDCHRLGRRRQDGMHATRKQKFHAFPKIFKPNRYSYCNFKDHPDTSYQQKASATLSLAVHVLNMKDTISTPQYYHSAASKTYREIIFCTIR